MMRSSLSPGLTQQARAHFVPCVHCQLLFWRFAEARLCLQDAMESKVVLRRDTSTQSSPNRPPDYPHRLLRIAGEPSPSPKIE
eukprot:6475672-Amphidinium_carterae.1